MIDIHSHAIYGVDDGSATLEQSVKMIKKAKEVGYNAICFTPHYMEDGYKSSRSELLNRIIEIKQEIEKENIDMKLYLGEEIFIFPNLQDKMSSIVTLNDTNYVLFELPLVEEVNYVDELVYSLQSMGYVPVLAHPERYLKTSNDFEWLKTLARKGVLLQVNLNSLIGHYGKDAKKLAVKLLSDDMVAFVGSDAHSTAGYHNVKESLKILKILVGNDKFIELTETNPRKVLSNLPIDSWDDRQKIHEKRDKFIVRMFKTFPILEKML